MTSPSTGTVRHLPGIQPPWLEIDRFAAGLRCIVAMLCLLALSGLGSGNASWKDNLLVVYVLWSGLLLWQAAHGQVVASPVGPCWGDVLWATLLMMMQPMGPTRNLLALTLVLPVVMASVRHGVRQGALLSLLGMVGLLVDPIRPAIAQAQSSWPTAVAVLTLAPVTALLTAPMAALRRCMALADRLETDADPRRGLESLCQHLAQTLCADLNASRIALILPGGEAASSCMAEPSAPPVRMGMKEQRHLETLLADLPPATSISWQARTRRTDLLQLQAPAQTAPAETQRVMSEVGSLLRVTRLHVLPLNYLNRGTGFLLIGYVQGQRAGWGSSALRYLIPTLERLIHQAVLVDELQSETAAHERSRIGRDLHDSAIQPYLGLKYAVEALSAGCPPDNPLQGRLQTLSDLVQHEIVELREMISVLRTGGGDNALLPAVRRQARRFQRLFGVQVHLDLPAELLTSRGLADAVFHLLNEAMNNVRKHTQARQIWVQLRREPSGQLQLSVRNDGGVATAFTPTSLSQRIRELNGSLAIDSPPSGGSTLDISLPPDAA